MIPTATKQYEVSISADDIRDAISKLSAHLCDLTEQALIEDEVDGDFEHYCQDLRAILANRPDPFPSIEDEDPESTNQVAQ